MKISNMLLSNENLGNIKILIFITEYTLRNKMILYTFAII